MNNAITYIDPYNNTRQNPEFYATELEELIPLGYYDEYRIIGSFVKSSIPRRVMAKILSHVSRNNVYPACKFIPITINQE